MEPERLDDFIMGNFGGVVRDFPWEKWPDYVVYRHGDNKKWFALVFYARAEVLKRLKPDDAVLAKYDNNKTLHIVNLKADEWQIRDIVSNIPGVLPAYHMNRTYWISVILDGSVPVEHVERLVDMSYGLTMSVR